MNTVIAVDFDGTLCVSAYPDIGPPREDILRKLKKEQCDGAKIIIRGRKTPAFKPGI